MNKFKYLSSILIVSVMNIHTVLASCTQEEINTFKRIEDDYTVKYEFDKSTKTYNLYFTASKPELYDYVIRYNEKLNCEEVNDTLSKCMGFKSGEYTIQIIGKTQTCNHLFKEFTLKLPKYNKLSEDPLCEGIEEFVLCNPSYEKEIDYESFVSRVEIYKKKNKPATEDNLTGTNNKKDENEIITKAINYLKDNWIEMTIVLIFVILVVITTVISIKSARKSRYLE